MGMLLAPYGSSLHGLYVVIFVAMLISLSGLRARVFHDTIRVGGGGERDDE